jgi:hypothetical protein
MKTIYSILIFSIVLLTSFKTASVQQDDTIAKGLGLFVFPSNDQSKEQQEADEYACYKWAKEQTGVNPMDPPEVAAEQVAFR